MNAAFYATEADIRERVPEEVLIQLTDDPQAGETDANIVIEAIRWADNVINGFLCRRYRLPFANPHPVLGEISADIAVYHLYSRRMDIVPEVWEKRWEFWRKWLEDVAKGDLALEDGTGGAGSLRVSAPRQEFTESVLDSFWRA